jgi:hypothetical protein
MNRILIIAFLLIPTISYAQQPKIGGPVGRVLDKVQGVNAPEERVNVGTQSNLLEAKNPLAKPLQDLADFINGDALGAIKLATEIPELQDPNGAACWSGFQTATKVFTAHPVPLTLKLMTDHEALRLLIMSANRLCANTACTVVFADAANIAQTASPIPLPIPSLQGLCSKIAQLAPPIPGLPAIQAVEQVKP